MRSIFRITTFILVLIAGINSGQGQNINRRQLAEEALSKGDLPSALKFANAAISAEATNAANYVTRSKILEGLGKTEAALTDLSIAVELQPEDAAIRFDRGWLAFREGRTDLARSDFRLILNNKNKTITNSVFYRQKYGRTDRIMTMESGIRDILLHYLGLTELKAGNYNRSIELFDSALAINQKDPDLFAHRAVANEKLGNLESAESDYAQAFRIDPTHPLSMQRRSELLMKQGKYDQAEAELLEVMRSLPPTPEFYAQRGYLRFLREKYSSAISDYDSAILLGQKDADIFINRGIACEKISRQTEAMEDYGKAIEAEPSSAKAWVTKGNLLLKRDDKATALEHFNVALLLDSTYAAGYHNRAIVFQQLGKKQEACRDLRKCEKLGMKTDKQFRSSVCGN